MFMSIQGKKPREIARYLLDHNISAEYYHAGLTHDVRERKQDLWQNNYSRVMVATNAFGMGIDKKDVRVVVHYDMPDSIEAYYQEAGRAGRDGKKAFAVLLYHPQDKNDILKKFESAHPEIDFVKQVYQALANYYKIAVGSNKLSYFDFDLSDFCERFDFNNYQAYHAIKVLEEEGYVSMNESFYHPSKVSFNLDHNNLYNFQIANSAYDPLIKSILRIYGGEAYNSFVKISETHLARQLNTSAYKVKDQLEKLGRMDVLTYDALKDKPQIAFLSERMMSSTLPLDKVRITSRKVLKKEKLDLMLKYVEATKGCRTTYILDYFGEYHAEDCGQCDYCLEKKKTLGIADQHRIEEMVHFQLRKGPMLPEEILSMFSQKEIPFAESMIRKLTDSDDLVYDDLGRLVWTGS